jgi:polar amino acid transport system substrate-binding protein
VALLLATGGIANARSSHTGRAGKGSSSLKLVNPGYLTVGSDTTYPPMESFANGTYVGADVDLAQALAKAMGLKGAKIVNNSFDTIIPAMTIRHRFDVIMSSMNDTPERRKQITFIDYIRLNAAESILVPKGSSLHANGYAGICGHSISVESGTVELGDLQTANKSCKNKIDIHHYTADTAAFQALLSGHTEAYTTDLPVALFYAKNYASRVRFAGKSFGSGAYYGIGLQKSAGGLKAALARALHKIRSNGVYLRVLRKYGLGSTALPGSH